MIKILRKKQFSNFAKLPDIGILRKICFIKHTRKASADRVFLALVN